MIVRRAAAESPGRYHSNSRSSSSLASRIGGKRLTASAGLHATDLQRRINSAGPVYAGIDLRKANKKLYGRGCISYKFRFYCFCIGNICNSVSFNFSLSYA